MPQIFHRRTNTLAKVSIFGGVFIIAAVTVVTGNVIRSPYLTEVGVIREQPIPFSHEHHVAGIGIDCRYCHTSVETSSFAGMPPTKTCMNCHSQVWADSPMLEGVRASFRENRPIAWTRVNDLPDFVYFDHSIHIAKGIGCVSCHGDVANMPLMWRAETLFMEWCLDCHRAPEKHVRPRDEVFSRSPLPADQLARGRELVREYGIDPPDKLTDCSICHR